MPLATGPWHTPPNLPDDPAELCLVLLFHDGAHFRYMAMRYNGSWQHQDATPLEAGWWVSRWAYITSSIERMSELPPVHELPPESRLFVPLAHTDAERLCLLTTYITELKKEVEHLRTAAARPDEGPELRRVKGELRHAEHVHSSQLSSRDARLAEQRRLLVEMRERVQQLASRLDKAERHMEQTLKAAANARERLEKNREYAHKLENKLKLLQTKAAARR